ncbi:MAG: glyceraldehyde-3-phosphate dehydrogenase [Bacteroidetes bacterium]|nr:glyceraldehyde-3-phosphate dehydrogenase [Bacteroidota bacterium]
MDISVAKPETLSRNGYESQLIDWILQEKAAIELISIIGNLWFEKSVELIIFRNQLVDCSSSQILKLHLYAKNIVGQPITVHDSLLLARELQKLDLVPSRIDIGRLGAEWLAEREQFKKNAKNFITGKLNNFTGKERSTIKPKDVVLFGFGRIGRLAARVLIAEAGKGEQLRLRAIVTRNNSDADIIKRAELLRSDSIHGTFPGTVIEDLPNKSLIINGHTVKMIAAGAPGGIDYESHGIHDALVIDNTGIVRDRKGLSDHLTSKGVGKVLLTAPGKGDIPNIVYGVNQEKFEVKNERIFSAASCTTNAIIPVLNVIDKTLGIVSGHMETIHSYTNDQNLLDNYHKKYRRGRSAPLNMVITETGAASAIAKILPSLAGKFTANAVRVPTPDVSLAMMHLNVSRTTSKEEVNQIMKDAALKGDLVEQIQYSYSNELVSSDLIGNPCAVVFDSPATIVGDSKKNLVLYCWYDNEFGYTKQVIRLSKYLAEVIRMRYY